MERSKAFLVDETPEPVYFTDDVNVSYKIMESLGAKRGSIRKAHQKDSREEFVMSILPVLDGFERLMMLAQEDQPETEERLSNWLKSIQVLHKRLVKALQKIGVEPIETLGSPLDLDRHEVEEVVAVTDKPTGFILDEIARGYTFCGRILRAAKVSVAKKEEPPELGDKSEI